MSDRKFSSASKKLARAKKHILSLEESISSYYHSDWHQTSFEKSEQGYSLSVGVKHSPDDFSEICGDTIHNLRAALDMLVVQAVTLNSKSSKNVMFPFCANESDFEETFVRRNCHKAASKYHDLIRSVRPYKNDGYMLRNLHDLDILDKHISLITHEVNVVTPEIAVVMENDGVTPKGFAEGKLELELKSELTPSIQFIFPKGLPLEGQPVLSSLKNFYVMIGMLIERFELLSEQ